MLPETFQRYAQSAVPRYTSYPTAPHFSSVIGGSEYHGWLCELGQETRGSLYFHIPFCRSMCWYCGCHTTVASRQAPIARYMEALRREVALVTAAMPHRLGVDHVHFGGGTPTMMAAEDMAALAALLRERFALAPDAELAIEIDPRTLQPAMSAALGAAGFTRASIGVQCFDPTVQRAINRVQSFDETSMAVEGLRAAGVGGINFDLIYGLPLQTLRSCLATIDQALALRPDRLAVFGYAHVPSFKPHQARIPAETLPDAALRLEQAQAISEALRGADYVQVGLDHYARPGDALAQAAAAGALRRNFQGYTTDRADALIGFGASAISRLPAGFAQNAVRIPHYQARVAAGELPIERGYRLSADDRLRGVIIERIMCDHRVDLAEVCRSRGAAPDAILRASELGPLVRDGLIRQRGPVIEVTEEAYPLVRSVAAAFDAHLPHGQRPHAPAV